MERMTDPFRDVHFGAAAGLSVSYRSAMTGYEEGLADGIYAALGWNGSGYSAWTRNLPGPAVLATAEFAEPQAFALEVDGQSLCSHWQLAGFDKHEEEKGLHAVVTLRHAVRSAEVQVHTLLDGTAILTRWISVTNTGDGPLALGRVAPLSGGLHVVPRWRDHVHGGTPYRLGYPEYSAILHEGGFRWHDLPNAGYYVGSRFLRKRHRHPMFVLEDRATGAHFVCQLAWSGGYRFVFDLNSEGTDAHLWFQALMDAPAPLRVVAPAETVNSAEVHIGMLFGDLDDCVNAMHEHVRRSVMQPQARGRGLWIESGIGPEEVMSQDAVLHHADAAAGIGAEVFFIDASWYSPPDETERWFARVGDWQANAERYPMGIDGIRDHVHAKGMLFGLWMEPERFGVDSGAFAEHSDWCTVGYDGRVRGEVAGGGGMVDLAKPDAAAWVEAQMAGVIERYQLDFFRLDFNATTASPFSCNERDGYLENSDWRYHEAFYATMERLRARFPEVIFEACASGGGRTDLGTVRAFCHTWVTDWQRAPRSFAITNGMTMCLPPEHVDRLLNGQDGFTTASLDFQVRLLLFVRPTIGSATQLGFTPNSVQIARIRHAVELYKEFVRPMLPSSRIFHHTPEMIGPDPKGTGILEVASRERDRAMMGLFQLSDPDHEERRVRFRGLDASGAYRVTLDTGGECFEADGRTVTMDGLTVRLGRALTSELLLAERIR